MAQAIVTSLAATGLLWFMQNFLCVTEIISSLRKKYTGSCRRAVSLQGGMGDVDGSPTVTTMLQDFSELYLS